MSLPLLVVQHVAWEGPHRVLDAFAGIPLLRVDPLDGGALPAVAEVRGAVFMGGPMSVNDTARHPALADELRWLERALERELPLLGVCLGAQLLARALGATVRPGAAPELGWGAIEVDDAADPVLGPLAPATEVLHWHGEVFDLPPGARLLAHSAATACQAFRAGASAWGLLFHAEADAALVERWLAEPSMAAEAHAALGADTVHELRAGAERAQAQLTARSARAFAAFAERCADAARVAT